MGVQLVALHHVQRNGAVGKGHRCAVGVDARRIGLKTANACQSIDDGHGEHGGNIALAAGHDTLGVKSCQGHAARVADSGEQVEATQREPREVVALHNGLQGFVDFQCAGKRFFIFYAQLFTFRQQLLHGNLHEFDAESLTHFFPVGMAGDEPVGGFSDDAEARLLQPLSCFGGFRENVNSLADVFAIAMDDFALEAVLAKVRENLHRGRERVAFARCQQVERLFALCL